jgi:hypothetical protein
MTLCSPILLACPRPTHTALMLAGTDHLGRAAPQIAPSSGLPQAGIAQ